MKLVRYRRLLGTPQVPRLIASTLVGRLPSGMLSLAIVLRITQGGGTYALAGVVTAGYALGICLTAPLLSRLVDRCGQTVVLVPCAVANLAATIALAALPASRHTQHVHHAAGSPTWLLIVASALVGATMPPLSSTSRMMWPLMVREPSVLESAYAADATFQELIFIVGPLLVVTLTSLFGTATAIVVTGALGSAGTLAFATSRGSRGWRAVPHIGRRRSALRSPGIAVLAFTMFALVTGFGATEVSLIASARHAASNGAAGVLLALWGTGSMIGGLVYGSRSWPGAPANRVMVFLGVITLVTAALSPLHSLVAIGAVVAVGGVSCAPALSGIYLAVQRVALPGVVTEAYSWLAVGTLLGAAVGSAVGGAVITAHGASAGFLVATAGVGLGAVIFAFGRHQLAPASTPASDREAIAIGS